MATQRQDYDPQQDWVHFSFERPETFEAALDRIDKVFLMRPPQMAKSAAFVPFLDALKNRGISRVVVLSVMGADTNRLLPHHGLEELVKRMVFDWTMVRPSDFMQNLETVHRRSIVERDEIAVPAGSGTSSFIDVEDVAEVAAKVLTQEGHSGKGYTITGDRALSFADVAEKMSAVLGRRIHYRPVGVLPFIRQQLAEDRGLGMSLVMTALYSVQRFGGASRITDEVLTLSGRSPRRLPDYLRRSAHLWSKPGESL